MDVADSIEKILKVKMALNAEDASQPSGGNSELDAKRSKSPSRNKMPRNLTNYLCPRANRAMWLTYSEHW